jgi:hypothetical protein
MARGAALALYARAETVTALAEKLGMVLGLVHLMAAIAGALRMALAAALPVAEIMAVG